MHFVPNRQMFELKKKYEIKMFLYSATKLKAQLPWYRESN